MKVSNSHERLKELLEIFGDSQADMVRKTGIEKSAISNYINGKREARQDKLLQIAKAYSVNPAWLMGLDVPRAIPNGEVAEAEQVYELYLNATPDIKKAVEILLGYQEPQS